MPVRQKIWSRMFGNQISIGIYQCDRYDIWSHLKICSQSYDINKMAAKFEILSEYMLFETYI